MVDVIDNAGSLYTITLGAYAFRRIGSESVSLTDPGFDPEAHQLYGISFTNFYRIDTTATATLVGPLGSTTRTRSFSMRTAKRTSKTATRRNATQSCVRDGSPRWIRQRHTDRPGISVSTTACPSS